MPDTTGGATDPGLGKKPPELSGQSFNGDTISIVPGGNASFIFRMRCAMCLGLFSSRCPMSRSSSAIARMTLGSSISAIGSPPSEGAALSLKPRGAANALICFAIRLLPHFGHTGRRSGFKRFERKLKIFRHFAHENS